MPRYRALVTSTGASKRSFRNFKRQTSSPYCLEPARRLKSGNYVTHSLGQINWGRVFDVWTDNPDAYGQRGNLHSLWDGFLSGRIEFRPARNRAIAIVNDDAKSAMGKAAATKLDEKTWLDESHQLCDTVA
jgi:hypothetical protein